MPSTTGYSFGDIVLVPFPFTDLTATKKRPAVVVSSDAYHRDRRDVIVMAVTSQARPESGVGESALAGWRDAGLLKPSVVKPVLATIDRDLILRRLGTIGGDDRQAVQRRMSASGPSSSRRSTTARSSPQAASLVSDGRGDRDVPVIKCSCEDGLGPCSSLASRATAGGSICRSSRCDASRSCDAATSLGRVRSPSATCARRLGRTSR